MRLYIHEVEESHIRRRLDRMLKRSSSIWHQIDDKEPEPDYLMGIAADAYFQAALAAWGLEDDTALGEHRRSLSRLATVSMKRFTGEDLCCTGRSPLYKLGFAADADVVRDLALHVHAQRSSFPVMDQVTAALTVGDDADAHSVTIASEAEFASAAVMPRHSSRLLPDVAKAILSGDDTALAESAQLVVAAHVEDSRPTRDQRSGPQTLAHAGLSVLCRVARWRGLTPPSSPYIVEMID